MHEMVELSKAQAKQVDESPQAVTFTVHYSSGESEVVTLKAGPSHFGMNLRGDQKVTGQVVIAHPFRGCTDLMQGSGRLKGKIVIMERGDCTFVEKARRAQKSGAIGTIIVDNVVSTSSYSQPTALFSMAGDGKDDVDIPSVFLFSIDASRLLVTLAKDPMLEVTLSELKTDTEVRPPDREEASVFQKLKISVQEFLNRHTGIAFTETVSVGSFKAHIDTDKMRITYEPRSHNDDIVPKEEVPNPQWSQIRRDLLKSITKSNNHELFMPLSILHVYYLTLSGDSSDGTGKTDVLKEAQWLLSELMIEHHKVDEDDEIVSDVQNISSESKSDDNLNKKLEKLNSIFQVISEIEKNVVDEMKKMSNVHDDLVVTTEHDDHSEMIDASATTDYLIIRDMKVKGVEENIVEDSAEMLTKHKIKENSQDDIVVRLDSDEQEQELHFVNHKDKNLSIGKDFLISNIDLTKQLEQILIKEADGIKPNLESSDDVREAPSVIQSKTGNKSSSDSEMNDENKILNDEL